MKIKHNAVLMVLMMLFLLASSMGLQKVLVETTTYDQETVQRLAEEGGEVEVGNSYLVTALVYSLVPESVKTLFVWVVGCFFLWFSFKQSSNVLHGLIIAFLATIPCIMTISTFQKDLLLVFFILPAALISQTKNSLTLKTLAIIGIYVAYAAVFRAYYFIIAAAFAGLICFARADARGRLLLSMTFCIGLLLVPISVWHTLQEPRDVVNAARIFEKGLGSRTAFLNPFPIDSISHFLGNYIYAVYRLNLSFLGSFSPKDAFFLVYVGIFYAFTLYGLRARDESINLVSLLILGHSLTLHLFEPDTGSYARHLSSTLPYLAIIVARYFHSRNQTSSRTI